MKFAALSLLAFSLAVHGQLEPAESFDLLPDLAMPAVCADGAACLRACDRGETDACLFAGKVFSEAENLASEDLAWIYQSACRNGEITACARAGWMASRTNAAELEGSIRGVEDWKFGCLGGDAPSCLGLADLKLSPSSYGKILGDSGAIRERARRQLSRQCMGRDFEACLLLRGEFPDQQEISERILEQLIWGGAEARCLEADLRACFMAILRHSRPAGMPPADESTDTESAIYLEAEQAEYRRRCLNLADFTACFKWWAPHDPQDEAVRIEAADAATEAEMTFLASALGWWCDRGTGAGCRALGQQALSREDNPTALAQLRRGCEAGDQLSCLNYADLELFLDDGDYPAALETLEKMPNCGGCWRLSDIYSLGIRVPRNKARTESYRQRLEFAMP